MLTSRRFLKFVAEGHIHHIFAHFDRIIKHNFENRIQMSNKYSKDLNLIPSSIKVFKNGDLKHTHTHIYVYIFHICIYIYIYNTVYVYIYIYIYIYICHLSFVYIYIYIYICHLISLFYFTFRKESKYNYFINVF